MDNRETEPTAFDIFQKDHALRILFDYSQATKRGWLLILKEIYSVVKPGRNEVLPTRQDLEAWARRDVMIGDSKFKWIYRFLTHPETLARPEFAHAEVLKHPLHNILRVGRVLADLFTDTKTRWVTAGFTSATIGDELDVMSGLYAANGTPNEYWSFSRIMEENFLVAHRFWVNRDEIGPQGDWHLFRNSGFMTLFHPIQCHLKDEITRDYRPNFFSINKYVENKLILHAGKDIYISIESAMESSENMVFSDEKLIISNAKITKLVKIDDQKLKLFVENFKWSVQI